MKTSLIVKKITFYTCLAVMALLLGSCCDCCDNEENGGGGSLAVITLGSPANEASVDLSSGNVTFSWTVENGKIAAFSLMIGKNPDLSDSETFFSTGTSYTLTAEEFNDLLAGYGAGAEEEFTVYWSVKPTSPKVDADVPNAQSLKVKTLSGPVIGLQTPAKGELVDLSTAGKVTFSWTSVPGIGAYSFVWGTSADKLENKVTAGVSPWDVSASQIIEWLGNLAVSGETVELFWSIEPASEGVDAGTQVSSVNLIIPKSTTTVELLAPENDSSIALKLWENTKELEFKWNEVLPAGAKLVLSKDDTFSSRIEFDASEKESISMTYQSLQEMLELAENELSTTKPNTLYWNIEIKGEIFSHLTRTITLTGWNPKLIYESDFTIPLPEGETLPAKWGLESPDAIIGLSDGVIVYSNNGAANGAHTGKKINYQLPIPLKKGTVYKFTTTYKQETENPGVYWFPQLNEIEGSWKEFVWDGGKPSEDKFYGRTISEHGDGSVTDITTYTMDRDVEKSRFSYMIGQFVNQDKFYVYSLKIEIVE